MDNIEEKAKIFLENIEKDIIEAYDNDLEKIKPILLKNAIRDNQLKAMKWLLENGVDINTPDGDNIYPLLIAEYVDNMQATELLLKYGADVSLLSLTHILMTIEKNKIEILKLWVESGLDLNKYDDKGTHLLFFLIGNQLVNDSVEYVVKNIPDINVRLNESAFTPLILASFQSNKEFVELLLKYGADVDLQNAIGDTALMNATYSGNIEIIKLLLEHDADIEIRQRNGLTALILACDEYEEFVSNVEIVKLLLQYGADVNARSNDGATALILAVENENIDIVDLLLEKGADIHFRYTNSKYTILHKATIIGNNNIIKLLLDNGSYIEEMDENGLTPLSIAILLNKIDTVKFLIQNGANVNLKYKKTISLLRLALDKDIKIIKLLIENGANINETLKTPMDMSLFQRFSYMIYVFSHGKYNLFKSTIKKNRIDVIKVFIEHNVKLDKGCLLLAVENNYIEIVQLLIGTKFYTKKDYLSVVNHKYWFGGSSISKEVLELFLNDGLELNLKSLLTCMDDLDTLRVMCEHIKDKEILKNLYSIAYENNNMKVIEILGQNNIKEKGSMGFLRVTVIAAFLEGDKSNGVVSKFFHSKIIDSEYRKYKEKDNYKPFAFHDYISESSLMRMINLKYEISFIENAIKKNICDINETGRQGLTPLMVCSKNGDYDMVQLLLKYGADIEIKDSFGQTAKDYCLGNEELIKLFDKNSMKHNPKELVRILKNFRKDNPIRFTTHDWIGDFKKNFKENYGDFNGFLNVIKEEWDRVSSDLEKLSPNLYKKIYSFLLAKESSQNWYSKNGKNISIGWSSLDGLDEWCDNGNDPFKYRLPTVYKIEDKTITTFGQIIELFKHEVQFRNQHYVLDKEDMLDELFLDIEEKLLSESFEEINYINLEQKEFYTDVEKFKEAIGLIFKEIKNQSNQSKKIKIEVIQDDSIPCYDIKITHIGSKSGQSSKDMLEKITGGDSLKIKDALKSICDWSIESSYKEENYRINCLNSNNIGERESLSYEPEGFTHILRFYK